MIYTCTLNPAIDLFVAMESFRPHTVNRTREEDYQANGKGINVSFILKRMGFDNTALGLIGGFTGEYIEQQLRIAGIGTDFIPIDGITRINIFINAEEEYKVVNRGPSVTGTDAEKILEKIRSLPTGATLVVSGSLPQGIDEKIYEEIASIAHQRSIRLVLDISSPRLLDCLPYQPYLVKPNEEELAQYFGLPSLDDAGIREKGRELLERGAQQVLVSLGERGSLYLSPGTSIRVTSPPGKVVNTACSGDALLASFLGRRMKGDSLEQALSYASAAGASTAFSKGLSDLSDVENLRQYVQVQNLLEVNLS